MTCNFWMCGNKVQGKGRSQRKERHIPSDRRLPMLQMILARDVAGLREDDLQILSVEFVDPSLDSFFALICCKTWRSVFVVPGEVIDSDVGYYDSGKAWKSSKSELLSKLAIHEVFETNGLRLDGLYSLSIRRQKTGCPIIVVEVCIWHDEGFETVAQGRGLRVNLATDFW
jgi:hypothetical protein